MFCDKCGKSNISGTKRCRYCGADMPEISADNGFSDILSFTPEEVTPTASEAPVYAQEPVYQPPVEDYAYASRTTLDTSKEKNKGIKLYGIIAIFISAILFISAIGICIATKVASDKAEERIEKREAKLDDKEEKVDKREKELKEKEKAEKAAKEKAEKEAKEKAEKEAREKAEKDEAKEAIAKTLEESAAAPLMPQG